MPDAAGVVLGLDYGSRRIGVAVGNAVTTSAQTVTTLANRGAPDWAALDALVAEWRPAALVVGLPLRADGGCQAMTAAARRFMTALGGRYALPVHAVDERFSTIEAAQRLRGARARGSRRRRLEKGDTDAMAAQVILESWLTGHALSPIAS